MTKTSVRIAALAAMIHVLAHTAPAQTPLGTAFTYQGRLNEAGQPFNGNADMVFRLYDAQTGGGLLGSQTMNGVPVADGLFTVLLDFGAGAFDSEARWLDVTVNGTPLAPRQAITATPYALSLAPGATIYGGANGLNTLSLYHSDAFTSAIYALHTATGGTALYGESDSGAGAKGVWGLTSEGIGVYGSSDAGAAGVYGQSGNPDGAGVSGQGTATSGSAFGVYGHSNSTEGIGVYGLTTTASGEGYGVFGQSYGFFGCGVYGWASNLTGNCIGVAGYAASPSGWAIYAFGDVGASGTKAFRIDHPDDPANKYLLHYAAESPEVINFYRGTVVLDGAGEAVVELPHYFAKINKTPSYQLTAVGAPMPMLHVAEEIDEAALVAGAKAGPSDAAPLCAFRIAGGVPGGKVCWRVEAVRNDLRMRLHGAPVERDKEGPERGKYQHPEYYNLPSEMGMNYDAERERRSDDRPSLATAPDTTRQK